MTSDLSCCFYNLGLKAVRENMPAKAISFLKKSVCFDNKNTNAWNLLGLCFLRMGKTSMAEFCWTESIENGDCTTARSCLNSLYEDKTQMAVSALAKAVTKAKAGKYREALTQLKSNDLLTSFESPQLLSYIGILEYLAGSKKEARAAWQRAVLLDQSDTRPACYLECTAPVEGNLMHRLRAAIEALFCSRA